MLERSGRRFSQKKARDALPGRPMPFRMTHEDDDDMDSRTIFGGNPLGVIIRLVILSIVVGVVLSALDITPRNFLYHIEVLLRRIYDLGFATFDWVLQYLILGAIVVVPIWLVARLFGVIGSRKAD